jgi:hypothetical protein
MARLPAASPHSPQTVAALLTAEWLGRCDVHLLRPCLRTSLPLGAGRAA